MKTPFTLMKSKQVYYYLPLLRGLSISFTVVFGYFLATQGLTYLPVIALRYLTTGFLRAMMTTSLNLGMFDGVLNSITRIIAIKALKKGLIKEKFESATNPVWDCIST